MALPNVLAGARPGDRAAEALAYALSSLERRPTFKVVTEDDGIVRASYFGYRGGWVIHNRQWGTGNIPENVMKIALVALAGTETAIKQSHREAIVRAAQENYEYDRSGRPRS